MRKRVLAPLSKRSQYRVPTHTLLYITKGGGKVLLDGEAEQLLSYELYYLPPGTDVHILELSEPSELYLIMFRACFIQEKAGARSTIEMLPLMTQVLPVRNGLDDPCRTHRSILEMYRQYKGRSGMDTEAAYSLRMELEKLIYELKCQDQKGRHDMDPRIARSIAHMESMYPEKMNIQQLAEVADINAAAYSRLFKRTMGLGPVEYLTRLRIEKAKTLLADETNRVKEVSVAVGFSSEFYFSRIFQRIVKISPAIFMKRDKLRVAVASSLGFQEYVSSLGIKPVSVIDLYPYPGLDAEEQNAIAQKQWAQLQMSRPDIIIGDHYHAPFKDRLSAVAPFVHIDSPNWDWKANYLEVAELVNRETAAKKTLSLLELRTVQLRGMLHHQLEEHRVTVMQVTHDSVRIQGKLNHPLNELLYHELALLPGAQVPVDAWRWEGSPDALPQLDTERLFIHKHHLQAGSEQMFRRIAGSQAWQNNAAVRNNNVSFVSNWFLWSWTPAGRLRILDDLSALNP
ncbi:helix-turn-helix domain-containing protein [Paenibacillus sp. YSY-4.3]